MTPPPTPDFLTRLRQDWARVSPGLDPQPMLTLVLLGRLHAALGRELEGSYRARGLNAAGWDLLLTLYRSAPPEGLTPTGLSELAAITGPSMTNRIQRLVALGLVERQAGERDRRSVHVRLTAQGRALVEELLPRHLATSARVLAALDPAQAHLLRQLAGQLLAGLEACGADEALAPT